MELVMSICKDAERVFFNEKSIKSIELRDDILYLQYNANTGESCELMFPDIGDVDYFLSNTLRSFPARPFEQHALESFANNLEEALKAYIKKRASGYGKTSNLSFCRFLVAHAIANLMKMKRLEEEMNGLTV